LVMTACEVCAEGDVLTVNGVAKRLYVSRAAVYALSDRGQLPARKLGGKLVFLKRELDAFLDGLPYRPARLAKP
jgi:excisionase family DNA binding protein